MAMRQWRMGKGSMSLQIGADETRLVLPLTRFAERIGDFRRFWKQFFAPQFFSDIQRNFKSQGGLVGGWRALSPAYAAWKRSVVGQQPILVFSGEMKRSFTVGDRNNVLKVTKDHVEVGSKLPRVSIHNQGRGRVPRRRILYMGPRRVYEPLLARFVAEEAKSAGMPNVRYGGRWL